MKTKFTISITELLKRPIIRNDFEGENLEWMNKMTDEEISQYNDEVYQICLDEGTPNSFPELNVAHMTKTIDRGILYRLFKMEMK